MNCQDFERYWNEWLDAEHDTAFGVAANRSLNDLPSRTDLDAHAASCPACAAIHVKFDTLRTAIAALPAPPAPSPEFVARLHEVAKESPRTLLAFPSRNRWLITAAAALVVLGVTLAVVRPWTQAEKAPVLVAHNEVEPRSITAALAEATSATLDLAREASAPAGRVGREVLSSAGLPDASNSDISLDIPAAPSSDLLNSVGHSVGEGVKPLSGSARQAFGFLIRATTGEAVEPASPTSPRGT